MRHGLSVFVDREQETNNAYTYKDDISKVFEKTVHVLKKEC